MPCVVCDEAPLNSRTRSLPFSVIDSTRLSFCTALRVLPRHPGPCQPGVVCVTLLALLFSRKSRGYWKTPRLFTTTLSVGRPVLLIVVRRCLLPCSSSGRDTPLVSLHTRNFSGNSLDWVFLALSCRALVVITTDPTFGRSSKKIYISTSLTLRRRS
jgi:hypothetical protein